MELWGWGRKNTADVNEKGQLLTSASAFSEDHQAAIDGDAYTMDIDNITVAAANNYLFVIKNEHSTKKMIVTGIHIAPNTDDEDQEMKVFVGGTFVYLAEGTAVLPTNLLAGKIGGAQGLFYVTDGGAAIITTVVVGLVAGRFALPNNVPYDCEKASNWIIPPDQCFMATMAKDDKFRGCLSFYYHD